MSIICSAHSSDSNSPKPPSILLVGSGTSVPDMTALILSGKYPKIGIYAAESWTVGLQMFEDLCPDMVITDKKMPVMSAARMVSEIGFLRPETTILLQTADCDDTTKYCIHVAGGLGNGLEGLPKFEDLFSMIDRMVEEHKRLISVPHTREQKLHSSGVLVSLLVQ